MNGNKKGYLEPEIVFLDMGKFDVLLLSPGNYTTDGTYDEGDIWGGFKGWG